MSLRHLSKSIQYSTPRVMPSNAEGTCSIPGQVAKGSNMARSRKAKT